MWSRIRDEGALVLVGDGLTAVVLGQAAPDAMALVGGERVERARHPDGTPRTDRLGRRLPLTPLGSPLAIRPEEQRTREVPACGVGSPGPRPGPATPGLLLGLWRGLLGGWCWNASPARRTSGRPGHANLPGLPPNGSSASSRTVSIQECIGSYVDFCQGSAGRCSGRMRGDRQGAASAFRTWTVSYSAC